MAFRFFRRMGIAPGLSLNFSKSGISPSIGVRGARVTLGRSGVRRTVGIPGTGMFYTTVDGGGDRGSSRRHSGRRSGERVEAPPPEHKLDLGFFERLTTPRNERAFVAGCKAYVAGRAEEALDEFERADGLADAMFLAGLLHLRADRLDRAEARLAEALSRPRSLSKLFDKYGLDVEVRLPITEQTVAHVRPSPGGALLALAETHQLQGRIDHAIRCLERLRKSSPDDPVVTLSLAELLCESRPSDTRVAKRVVRLTGDVRNESSVHAAVLLYKARALRTLGMASAARSELTRTLRRKKHRDPELIRTLRYERALAYEDLGQPGRARRDLETIFAEDPDHEDVAQRLGV